MTEETTVSTTPAPATEPDEQTRARDAEPKHETLKRQKTWGEHIFNWRTYGGIALLGNEAASLAITEYAEKGSATRKWYSNTMERFAKMERAPAYIKDGRMFNVLLAVIGGMLMVPFVKYAEDHKGEQVRKLDRDHYGALSDNDPKLIEAHKEMDEAPKQTWGSLWKGRALTVAAALGVDALIGWKHAPSTKLFKDGSTAQKFSSMSGIAEQTAEGVVSGLTKMGIKFSPKGQELTKTWVDKGTWLMVLSSTLTVLFYASSKLFAKKHEQKVERKQEQHLGKIGGANADIAEDALEAASPETAPAEMLKEKPASEKPTPQVKSISREETISSVPQLSQALN